MQELGQPNVRIVEYADVRMIKPKLNKKSFAKV